MKTPILGLAIATVAFGGSAPDVAISNIVIEKYATRAEEGKELAGA